METKLRGACRERVYAVTIPPWLAFFLVRPVPAVIHRSPANLVVQGAEEESLSTQRKERRGTTFKAVKPPEKSMAAGKMFGTMMSRRSCFSTTNIVFRTVCHNYRKKQKYTRRSLFATCEISTTSAVHGEGTRRRLLHPVAPGKVKLAACGRSSLSQLCAL